MKTCANALVLGLIGSLGLAPLNLSADLEISAGVQIHGTADFYSPLSPLGSWVTVGSYGRCWHPASVAIGWRPYCTGYWEWTDCGWYWVSDEPWAWACYHYGAWIDDPMYGWVWVPDIEWAPSWVYWRIGTDYIGWAPCGPRGMVLASPAFVFVDVHHFRDPVKPSTVMVNNTTIIKRTKLVTEIKRETRTIDGIRQRVVINEGPRVASIQKATGKAVTTVPIRQAVSQTPVPAELRRARPTPTGREKARVVPQQPSTSPTPGQPPPAGTGLKPPLEHNRPPNVVTSPPSSRVPAPDLLSNNVTQPTGRDNSRIFPQPPASPPPPGSHVGPVPQRPVSPQTPLGREKEKRPEKDH